MQYLSESGEIGIKQMGQSPRCVLLGCVNSNSSRNSEAILLHFWLPCSRPMVGCLLLWLLLRSFIHFRSTDKTELGTTASVAPIIKAAAGRRA